MKTIGVLALQGDYQKHADALKKLGVNTRLVKALAEFFEIDALIIPGGESTTMGILIQRYALASALNQFHQSNKPIWGTCAGMILLAKQIQHSDQFRLGWMDITVARYAYGRQLDSFTTLLNIPALGDEAFPATFIRAPQIVSIDSPEVEVLTQYHDHPVCVRQKNLLASAFHPELSDDLRLHDYFLKMIA